MTNKRRLLTDSPAARCRVWVPWMIKARSTSSGSCGLASFHQVTYFGCLNHPLQISQLRVRKVIKLGSNDAVWRVISDVSHSVNKSSHNPKSSWATSRTPQGSSAITVFQHLQIICSAMATETAHLPQEILKPESGAQRKRSFCSIWMAHYSSKKLKSWSKLWRLDKIVT